MTGSADEWDTRGEEEGGSEDDTHIKHKGELYHL